MVWRGSGGRARARSGASVLVLCGAVALASCKTNDIEIGSDLPLTEEGSAAAAANAPPPRDAATATGTDAGAGVAGAGPGNSSGGSGAVDAGAASGCAPGTADCDGDPQNGCEVDLTSDDAHCGTCGMVCPTGFNIESNGATCIDGVCVHACHLLHGDCDDNLANGCETSLWLSNEHCGACGVACTCVNGVCM